MSDDLPGFIDDDQPQKKPAQPETGAAGFNPFADVEVESNPLGLAKAPTPSRTPPSAKPPATSPAPSAPKPKPAEAGFNAFAGAADAPAAAADEADIKPGQGKDLWACPHCGAKNKPERGTCRECGKSPSDPVIIPFMKTPVGRFGVPAAVVIVLLLLGWLLFGGSVALVPAGPSDVDTAVRRGGPVGAEEQIAGLIFQPRERIAVSGRVLGTANVNGLTAIVLALGRDARDDDAVAQVGVDFAQKPPRIMPELRTVLLYAFGAVPSVNKGDWLSVLGDGGRLIRDGVYATDFDDGDVIRIEQSNP